jgi:DNA-binding LacI/PurR family transcriptional regulator
VVHDLRSADSAAAAVTALFRADDAPTARFTSQNLVTIGAIRALQELGLHDRVAVVGFDDFRAPNCCNPGSQSSLRIPPRSAAPPRRWSSDASTVSTGHQRNTSFLSS